jgi:hypothetical protein
MSLPGSTRVDSPRGALKKPAETTPAAEASRTTQGRSILSSMRPRHRHWLGLLAACMLCASPGCNELQDLFALQSALADEYGEVQVNVDVNGGRRSMELRLPPSAVEGRSHADAALQAARSARAAYPHPVDRWIVVFGNKTDSGALQLEWSVGRYEFASSDL